MQVSGQPYPATLSAGGSSPGSTSEHFDYSTAIDPALDGGGVQIPVPPFEGTSDFKQSLENASSYQLDHHSQKGKSPFFNSSLMHPHNRLRYG